MKQEVTITREDILNALDSVRTVLQRISAPPLNVDVRNVDVRVDMSTGKFGLDRPPYILIYPSRRGRGVFAMAEYFHETVAELPEYHTDHYKAYGFRVSGVDVYELLTDDEYAVRKVVVHCGTQT